MTYSDVTNLSLGAVVYELIETTNLEDAMIPKPWSLRLNDWRNIAQHHSSEVEGDGIKASFNVGSERKEIYFERDELFNAARHIFLIFNAIRTARVIFVFDNIKEIALHLDPNIAQRVDMLVLSFISAIGKEGFQLLDLDVTEESVTAHVGDLTDLPRKDRRFHASQFVYPLWLHFKKEHLCIHYFDVEGNKVLTATVGASVCQDIYDEKIHYNDLATQIILEVHKK